MGAIGVVEIFVVLDDVRVVHIVGCFVVYGVWYIVFVVVIQIREVVHFVFVVGRFVVVQMFFDVV